MAWREFNFINFKSESCSDFSRGSPSQVLSAARGRFCPRKHKFQQMFPWSPGNFFKPLQVTVSFFEILYGSFFWSRFPRVVQLTGYAFFEVDDGLIVDV